MEYILRSTRHKTVISKGELEDVYKEYQNRIEVYPASRFEIINALGEKVDVESVSLRHNDRPDSDVRESVSSNTSGELSVDTEYRTESSTDSSN